tara:strand:+ start:899 stop:1021 length:123 start_codon:yes stop_codon:yes gene_type:complete
MIYLFNRSKKGKEGSRLVAFFFIHFVFLKYFFKFKENYHL